MRGYIFQHTEESAQLAYAGLDRSREQADLLRGLLPVDQHSHLDRMTSALQRYRAAIETFKVGMDATIRARTALASEIGGLLEINGNLYRNQQTKMLGETQQARIQTMLTAFASALLGLLAAWFIARQIILPLRHTWPWPGASPTATSPAGTARNAATSWASWKARCKTCARVCAS